MSENKSLEGVKIFSRTATGDFVGVARTAYKQASEAKRTFAKITRTNLIGHSGEPCAFHLRYFEIAPGGFSSYEKHKHIHAVIIERGKGLLVSGEIFYELKTGDVVYVGSNVPHQFRCEDDANEPLGFFCIVDAQRDKPVLLPPPDFS